MAAFGKRHTHHRVAGIEQAEENGHIGLSSGVRLYVNRHFYADRFAEEFEGTFFGQRFGLINILAAAVVAFAGISFGILIGQHRALGRHNGRRGVVLTGNQFNLIFLTFALFLNDFPYSRVRYFDGRILVEHVLFP